MVRRSGRRPGKQDTRDTILTAARTAFADGGYDGASIRQIGTAAGVDPALVHHYFGNKESLFRAVMEVPIDPEVMIPGIFAEGVDAVPERLARTFLSIWENPATGPVMVGMLRSGVSHSVNARLLRDFFTTQIVRRVISQVGDRVEPEEVPFRASLVASQLFGLALTRYVLEFEPIASTEVEAVVTAVAPTIRRYLLEDLSGAGTG